MLDVSVSALDRARARLGQAAGAVTWIAADVTGVWQVARYDAAGLACELGAGFTPIASREVDHRLSAGVIQPFCYAAFRRSPHRPQTPAADSPRE